MSELAVVILAAGSGSRLGGVAKALLRLRTHTYLETICATAREVGLAEAVIVVGPPYGDAVARHAHDLGLRVVTNPEPSRGMASSVALGFAALTSPQLTAAWLWPVDHPDVCAATLRALIAALGDHDAAQPRLGDRGGHPPLVARALWARLAECAEVDGGARAVIAASRVARVAVDDPGVVRDIDTPEDVLALESA